MIEYLTEPEISDELFHSSLEESYGGWGSADLYDWSFRRNVGSLKACRILGTMDGVPAYGAAIYHVDVRDKRGAVSKAGIVGDGWTLPPYRRKGISRGGINFAKGIALEDGLSALLGFVKKENLSHGNMISCGGKMLTSRYCSWKGGGPGSDLVPDGSASIRGLLRRREGLLHGKNGFHYAEDEWAYQFLKRPGSMEVLSFFDGKAFLVVQRKMEQYAVLSAVYEDLIDLEALFLYLMDSASVEGKSIFHYTTVRREWELLEDMGFILREGSLALFELKGEIEGEWVLHQGDKM